MSKRLINKKGKGTSAERELIHNFWESGWVCVRVAGSGSSKYPSPDIIAGKGFKKIVMEVKFVNATKKYFSRQEINDLNYFAKEFGAESWVGIKFKENQWFFIPTTELEETKTGNFVISLITMKRRGFSFNELIS